MKHNHKFLSLLVCIAFLSGCFGITPETDEAEATHLVPSSTVTLTPTSSATSTLNLPSATPTYTATPTPPSIPTLISERNLAGYQLVKPSAESLLRLIDIVSIQHNYYRSYYNHTDNQKYDFMLNELSILRDVIHNEIRYYYPGGFSDPQIVWNFYPPKEKRWFPSFSPDYLDLLSDAVLVDLGQGDTALSDHEIIKSKGYDATVHKIELDYDSSPEWLVRIDWIDIDALSWLALDQKSDLSFTKLNSSLPAITWWPSEDQIQALEDFTGDGLTDIIFLDYGYVMGTDFGTFYVSQGTKNGFKQLDAIHVSIPGYLSEGLPFTIETPSGSSWLNLAIADPHNINWGCKWDTVTSYRWPYGSKQVTIKDREAPNTPDCSLARAVSLFDEPDPRIAANLIEDVITRFDKSDPDLRAKILFAHYRLAILYAIMENDALAREHIGWLIQSLNESEGYFKSGLQSLLNDSTINPIHLCDVMYSAADADIPEEWGKFVNATAAFNAYPYAHEVYPPVICPLRDIISDKLNEVDWTLQPLTEEAFTKQGIPVVSIQTYPIPYEERVASFLLVGANTLYVLAYVPTMDGWEWRLMTDFNATYGTPQAFYRDVTDDGFPELAYFQASKHWFCPQTEQAYEIFLTTFSGLGFVSLSRTVCHPAEHTFEVTDYLSDANKDGVVDWVADQIYEAAGDSFLTAERDAPATWFTPDEIRSILPEETHSDDEAQVDLLDELYQDRNIETVRQQLIAQRDGLIQADVFADREWQRLTYLIAMSYEIEGKTDQAIEMFASILDSRNQTLWGNLAELHLTEQ